MTKKETILTACIEFQQQAVNELKEALQEIQESANQEKSGEESDSSKEQMQYEADRYSRQLEQARVALSALTSIDPNATHVLVKMGSVVITDKLNLLVGPSIGKIQTPEGVFVTISSESPLYEAMVGKKKGEEFIFRDMKHTVKEVF